MIRSKTNAGMNAPHFCFFGVAEKTNGRMQTPAVAGLFSFRICGNVNKKSGDGRKWLLR